MSERTDELIIDIIGGARDWQRTQDDQHRLTVACRREELKEYISALEASIAALREAAAWHPASEPPDSNGDEEIEIIGKARYWKSTHPLNNPWGHIEITGWRIPTPPEGDA